MKALVDTFLSLPTSQAVGIAVATFLILFLCYVVVAFVAYVFGIRAGQRAAIARHNHFTTKRRELASIQL